MPGQIVNISWKSAVSETALKCGDPFFKDFPKHIYSQAVFRAERGIAKDYAILDRIWEYTNIDGSEEIDIGPLNFEGEWWITVTPADDGIDENDYSTPITIDINSDGSYTYERKQWEELFADDVSTRIYAINYIGNRYVLRYSSAAVDDVIKIYYVSSIAGEEDYEYYDNEGNVNLIPVLPNKYYEETVRRAVVYISRLGLAKFDEEKARRYDRVLKLHQQQKDVMPQAGLERDRPWMTVKCFSLQYP